MLQPDQNIIIILWAQMTKLTPVAFYRTFLLLVILCGPIICSCQDIHPPACSDIRNGVFYYFGKGSDGAETFIRKGALQREQVPAKKETVLWEVEWISDCIYTLKYQSGAENHPEAELKFLAKHLFVTEVLLVTENYLVFRSAFDKATNPTVLKDTIWIKQRQSQGGKVVINPNADSVLTARNHIRDSLDATYSTLYVFRPGKSLNCLKNYNLLINGEPACVISNGCREILKLHKTGLYRLSAKVDGPEQAVTIDVKPGESYYLQCQITWGVTSHPILRILDKTVGDGAFKTAEKPGLWHKE
jgi:hypothetical protein